MVEASADEARSGGQAAFLKRLPYILFYILAFRDPYSTIIPVKEPALTYSPETTWLLDGSTNGTDFAAAYNRQFHGVLQDERNAFPYFLKAVEGAGYTPSGKAILGAFAPRGDNEKAIPAPGPDSPLRKALATAAVARTNHVDAVKQDDRQSELFQIMDRINLPAGVDRYEEPLLSDPEDVEQLSLLLARYIVNLPDYGKDVARTGKALAHLRLLANTPDPGRLMLVVASYRRLVNDGPLGRDEIRKLEKDLPPWPDARSLVTRLQRGGLIGFIAGDHNRWRKLVGVVRKKDRDFFLDRNEVLRTVNGFVAALDGVVPGKPLDEASEVRAKVESIAASIGRGQDSRTLAERILFSGSIREDHRRAAQYIGGRLCSRWAGQLCAAMDGLAKVYEPIHKDTPSNGL